MVVASRRCAIIGAFTSISMLSGCSEVLDEIDEPVPDISVTNTMERVVTVEVGVTESDGESIIQKTVEIQPGADKGYDDVLRDSGIVVSIDVHDGPSDEYHWDEGVLGNHTLSIRLEQDEIKFSKYVY